MPQPASGSRRLRPGPGVVAFVLSVISACAAGAVRGTYPFGGRSRNTNDLGEQYIPMLTYARDVVTGNAHGDLVFSWQSGHGVPFLGDALAYVGTTLSWIVLALPRERIDLALFLVYLCALGFGAAAMTLLLRRLRPAGPTALAIAGGVAYGTSAWPVETAYMTVWLNGMVAFPVLCLVADWVAERSDLRRWLVAPPVVALAWTSHFYTVYMATIGAAIFLVARLLTQTSRPWRERARGLLRTGVTFAAGIALTAPLMVPVFRLVQGATPSPPATFQPASWEVFAARLLPATGGVADSPAISVGVLGLVLAVTAVANGNLRPVERVAFPAMVVLTVLTMQANLGHLVWHAFDTPNGNPYRQSFVTCGLLVITGWMSVSVGIARRTVFGAVAAVGVLAWWTHGVRVTTPVTVSVVLLMLALVLVAWLLLDLPRAVLGTRPGTVLARTAAPVVGLVLLAGTTAESVVSQVAIDSRRSEVLGAIPMTPVLRKQVRDLVLAHDSWPASRTSAGAATSVNDPMLIGGEGSEYYTSTIQLPVTRLHQTLGWGYSSYGRALVDPATPVTDALFAVHRRVTEDPVTGPTLLVREQTAPLVTVRPSVPRPSTRGGVWGAHERALGASLYDVPTPTFSVRGATLTHSRTGYRAHSTSPGTGTFTMRAVCGPESEAFLWAPALVGDYVVQGQTRHALPSIATRPGIYTGLPIQHLGTVGSDGIVDVRFTLTTSDARLGHVPVGCLRPHTLSAAVAALGAQGASDVETTNRSISFAVARGEGDRSAVLAVPLLPGWSCTGPVSDGTPNGFEGLMAVPLTGDPGTVACSYRPPGLRLGLLIAGSVLSCGVLAGLGLLIVQRHTARRRSTTRLPR